MNSGDEPNRTINSIAFYNEDVFGLDKMYRPTTEKLAYRNNRINLIFAHYNNFGELGDHSGDNYY